MKKYSIYVVVLMSFVNANSYMQISRIAQVITQLKHLNKRNVWWVTDLDGTLVTIPSFEFIEAETKEAFDVAKKSASRVLGLTATEKIWAVKTGKDLDAKDLEFHDEEVLHDQLIALNSTGLNTIYNGVIYAGGPKGYALVDYIKFIEMLNQPRPEAIIFTDDKQKNVESVLQALVFEYPSIMTVGLFYTPYNSDLAS